MTRISRNDTLGMSGSLTLSTSLSVLVEKVTLESISESTLQGIWKKEEFGKKQQIL